MPSLIFFYPLKSNNILKKQQLTPLLLLFIKRKPVEATIRKYSPLLLLITCHNGVSYTLYYIYKILRAWLITPPSLLTHLISGV